MLSVVILTKNEENRIKTCLESVKWADELIIVDNGSTDDTLKIAGKYTDKIFKVNFQDFAEIRNFAIKKTSGEWVLFVDADERVLEDLKSEIRILIDKNESSAYAISRINIVFGKEEKYGPFWPDWVVRLLRKSDFEEWIGKVHEYPRFNGKLGYTKNSLLHLTHRNINQIVMKSLEWSKIDAKLRLDSGHPKMSGWRFLRILITEIFYQGVIRRGFFNGTRGTMDAILQSFSLFLTYVRLWELQQPKPMDDVYNNLDQKLVENNFKY